MITLVDVDKSRGIVVAQSQIAKLPEIYHVSATVNWKNHANLPSFEDRYQIVPTRDGWEIGRHDGWLILVRETAELRNFLTELSDLGIPVRAVQYVGPAPQEF